MDLWELLMITIRRWKITVPVAILAFGGAFMAAQSTPPEYTADAAVGLLGASFTPDPNNPGQLVSEDNPLVVANQGRTALAFTEKAVTSSDQKRNAVENGFSENYTVTLDRFNPVLEVDVVAPDPETAVDTAAYVVELIKADVTDTQIVEAGLDDENLQLRPTELYVDEVAGEDVTPPKPHARDLARDRADGHDRRSRSRRRILRVACSKGRESDPPSRRGQRFGGLGRRARAHRLSHARQGGHPGRYRSRSRGVGTALTDGARRAPHGAT